MKFSSFFSFLLQIMLKGEGTGFIILPSCPRFMQSWLVIATRKGPKCNFKLFTKLDSLFLLLLCPFLKGKLAGRFPISFSSPPNKRTLPSFWPAIIQSFTFGGSTSYPLQEIIFLQYITMCSRRTRILLSTYNVRQEYKFSISKVFFLFRLDLFTFSSLCSLVSSRCQFLQVQF